MKIPSKTNINAPKKEKSKQRRQVIAFTATPLHKLRILCVEFLVEESNSKFNPKERERDREMKESSHAFSNDSTFGNPKN